MHQQQQNNVSWIPVTIIILAVLTALQPMLLILTALPLLLLTASSIILFPLRWYYGRQHSPLLPPEIAEQDPGVWPPAPKPPPPAA